MTYTNTKILGIKIDKITLPEAVVQVEEWVSKPGKHYIVTPNVEFIMAAQSDTEFKRVLNEADLAIPDSARIGWAYEIKNSKSKVKKLLLWPFFIFPRLISDFPVTTGTDLMSQLISEASKKGFTIGFVGGRNGVAVKLKECLLKEYPSLKIVYASDGPEVDYDGNMIDDKRLTINEGNKNHQSSILNHKSDILFVAFGQVKQEKWIANNIGKLNVKVCIGVGGAFDYLSGDVPRAPVIFRSTGFEWLYRLIIQPWRIKRFGSLVRFVLTCLR